MSAPKDLDNDMGIWSIWSVRPAKSMFHPQENHRTDTEYEDNLIAKTFMFQFVNSYASLVYIAFIKEHIGRPWAMHDIHPYA